MTVHLVTPWAALVVVVVVVPLAGLALTRHRSARVRTAVGLEAPPRGRAAGTLAALVLTIALLALAAAQPVVASHENSTIGP